MNEYDIAVDYWARTLERVSSGFLYPEPWYDASLIMFQDAQAMRVQMNFFAFVQPFSGSVWYLIAFTIIFTATVFYLIHFLNNRLETHEMNINFGNTLFQTFSASTGQNELQSDYMANKIVIASMIFWSLLIVTCYVASLTSFLVNRNYVKIENFEELMNKEYQEYYVCVPRYSAGSILMQTAYPTVNYIRKESELDIFEGVNSGKCKIGVITFSFFKTAVNDNNFNPHCHLEWVGRKVTSEKASFVINDSYDRCSSLLRDVLDIYLLEIMRDKTLDKIFANHNTIKNDSCDASEISTEDSDKLYVSDLAGIFLIHFVILLISFIVDVIKRRSAVVATDEEGNAQEAIDDNSVTSNMYDVMDVHHTELKDLLTEIKSLLR